MADPQDRMNSENTDAERHAGVSGRETYNIVSDTVTGPNVRVKDNVFQAIVITACLVLGVILGAVIAEEAVAGALMGGFLGLLVGLFGSGIFLMIYRALLHLRGRHD